MKAVIGDLCRITELESNSVCESAAEVYISCAGAQCEHATIMQVQRVELPELVAELLGRKLFAPPLLLRAALSGTGRLQENTSDWRTKRERTRAGAIGSNNARSAKVQVGQGFHPRLECATLPFAIRMMQMLVAAHILARPPEEHVLVLLSAEVIQNILACAARDTAMVGQRSIGT